MSHMIAQITEKTDWIEIDTAHGIWCVPVGEAPLTLMAIEHHLETERSPTGADLDAQDILSATALCEALQFTEATSTEEVNTVRVIKGYGVRMSAPGYLDCTDWAVYSNKREALREARELEREDV